MGVATSCLRGGTEPGPKSQRVGAGQSVATNREHASSAVEGKSLATAAGAKQAHTHTNSDGSLSGQVGELLNVKSAGPAAGLSTNGTPRTGSGAGCDGVACNNCDPAGKSAVPKDSSTGTETPASGNSRNSNSGHGGVRGSAADAGTGASHADGGRSSACPPATDNETASELLQQQQQQRPAAAHAVDGARSLAAVDTTTGASKAAGGKGANVAAATGAGTGADAAVETEAGAGPGAGAGAGGGEVAPGAAEAAGLDTATTADASSLASLFASTAGYPHSNYDYGPPLTDDEQMRVQALRALDVLHTAATACALGGAGAGTASSAGAVAADGSSAAAAGAGPNPQQLQRLSRLDEEVDVVLAAVLQVFGANNALLVLFEEGRILVRNSAGGLVGTGEFPNRWSFCAYTLGKHRPQTLVVPDATKDIRFAHNPFVYTGPKVRFYCGAPLVGSSGHVLGTLCFSDSRPRPDFDAGSCRLINNMAELMTRQLERYKAHAGPAGPVDAETTALSRVARTLDCYDSCVGLVDVATWLPGSGSGSGGGAGWIVMFINEQLEALVAPRRRADVVGRGLQALLEFEDGEEEGEAEEGAGCYEEDEEEGCCEDGQEDEQASPEDVALAVNTGEPPPLQPMPAAARRRRAVAQERRRLAASALDSAGAYAAAADPAARWGRVAAALARGEVVDVGRVRLLCEDGRPSTSLAHMHLRPANCHVLDAATRMPVGIPPQLQLPASILAAGSVTPPPPAPTTTAAPAAAGSCAKAGSKAALLGPAAARLLDTPNEDFSTDSNIVQLQPAQQQHQQQEAQAATAAAAAAAPPRAEPHYCFVMLTPLAAPARDGGAICDGDGCDAAEEPQQQEEDDVLPDADVAGVEAALAAATTPTAAHAAANSQGNGNGNNGNNGSASASARGGSANKLPPCSASTGAAGASIGGLPPRRRSVETAPALPAPRAAPRSSLGARPSPGSAAAVAAAAVAAAAVVPRSVGSPGVRSLRAGSGAQAPGSPGLAASGGSYRPSSQQQPRRSGATPGPGATAGPGGGATAGAQWSYGMSPLPGLVLGHLLGKGGFGRVFAATYKGQRVAAKVVSNSALRTCVNGVSLEVLLAQEVEHPYVVRTYKCLVRTYTDGWPGDAAGAHASGAHAITSGAFFNSAAGASLAALAAMTTPNPTAAAAAAVAAVPGASARGASTTQLSTPSQSRLSQSSLTHMTPLSQRSALLQQQQQQQQQRQEGAKGTAAAAAATAAAAPTAATGKAEATPDSLTLTPASLHATPNSAAPTDSTLTNNTASSSSSSSRLAATATADASASAMSSATAAAAAAAAAFKQQPSPQPAALQALQAQVSQQLQQLQQQQQVNGDSGRLDGRYSFDRCGSTEPTMIEMLGSAIQAALPSGPLPAGPPPPVARGAQPLAATAATAADTQNGGYHTMWRANSGLGTGNGSGHGANGNGANSDGTGSSPASAEGFSVAHSAFASGIPPPMPVLARASNSPTRNIMLEEPPAAAAAAAVAQAQAALPPLPLPPPPPSAAPPARPAAVVALAAAAATGQLETLPEFDSFDGGGDDAPMIEMLTSEPAPPAGAAGVAATAAASTAASTAGAAASAASAGPSPFRSSAISLAAAAASNASATGTSRLAAVAASASAAVAATPPPASGGPMAALVAAAAAAASAGGSEAGRERLPEGETWIVQEYCSRGTLQDAIDTGLLRTAGPSAGSGGPTGAATGAAPAAAGPTLAPGCSSPWLAAILLTAQEVASAMHCLHSRGYMHGDLSAVNVLLTDTPPTPPPAAASSGPDLLASDPTLTTTSDAGHAADAATAAVAAAGPAPPSGVDSSGSAVSAAATHTAASRAAAAAAGAAAATAVRGWVAKVSDFGLSKHLPDPATPHVSAAHGVITHTAPEVLMTHCQTQKSDVYSFGVLMWQMWTGSRPWANMSRFQILSAVTNPANPGLRFLPACPPPPRYADLARRCLSFDPAQRPGFDEVCDELRLMTFDLATAATAAAMQQHVQSQQKQQQKQQQQQQQALQEQLPVPDMPVA